MASDYDAKSIKLFEELKDRWRQNGCSLRTGAAQAERPDRLASCAFRRSDDGLAALQRGNQQIARVDHQFGLREPTALLWQP